MRDLRQLLIHRHRLVQIRTRVKNGLQHLAMNRGMQKKNKLWSAAGQRAFLAVTAARLGAVPAGRSAGAVGQAGRANPAPGGSGGESGVAHPQARLLMTQPGVGAITALAFVVTIGTADRFPRGKQVASYLVDSARTQFGGQQRLGISKQGNGFLRMLLVEAAQTAVRLDEELRKKYQHRCHRKAKA